jgi:hypothetical protein
VKFVCLRVGIIYGVSIMAELSPEVLSKLVELIKATGAGGTLHSPFLDYLKGATDFFNSIAWPATAVAGMFLFREKLAGFIGGINKLKTPVGEFEISQRISNELEQSAKEVGPGSAKSSAPSKGELIRATEIERLAASTGISTIKMQAEELAAEYERVRQSMLPGDPRTREMEVVVSKMRTLARAFFPLRLEFANSVSPGKRLMAIAALQVDPDYDMLDWLADRLPVEKPFVGYHALVALLLAIRAPKAEAFLPAIEAAVKKARSGQGTIGSDTDRIRTLDDIEKALAALQARLSEIKAE